MRNLAAVRYWQRIGVPQRSLTELASLQHRVSSPCCPAQRRRTAWGPPLRAGETR